IIRQGDAAGNFFILIEGEVSVMKATDSGAESEIARLGPAHYFGDAGLLAGAQSPATVRCRDVAVHVLIMARAEFISLVDDMALLSSEIALLIRRRFLARRLRAAMPQLSGTELAAFSDDLQMEKVAAGGVIVRQGDIAETFHIVAAGKVEVVLEDEGA